MDGLSQVTKALDALLQGLSVVAGKAADELGAAATEEEIVRSIPSS